MLSSSKDINAQLLQIEFFISSGKMVKDQGIKVSVDLGWSAL